MRRARLAPVVAAVAIGSLLAGCGGGSSKHDTGTAATQSGKTQSVTGSGNPGESLETTFERVIRDVSPAVVLIQTKQGLGSGVVYDDKGDIVTNAHVVGAFKTFTVTLSGGDRHPAKLVGTDPLDDLAVIQLDSGSPKPATFGDSSKLAVGQLALAMGNPLGLRSSVTDGIISSLGRTVSEGNGVVISAAIQTSASINPGNSGGALVDISSEVVGIPTLAAIDPEFGQQAPGIGFAIPSSTVKRVAPQLIAQGAMTRTGHAYLGVSVATGVGGAGALVFSVERGGPTDKAGVRRGDIITALAGQRVSGANDLTTILATLKPGQTVPLVVTHADGSTATVKVTLAERPG